MISLDVRSNLAQVRAQFAKDYRQQLPLATAKALTFTIQAVREAERAEMQRVFDRPTPFTLRSLFIKTATVRDLTARTWFKELGFGPHYLVPQIHGGDRPLKRMEMRLQRRGLLPAGWRVVPGSAVKRDAYGNVNRGQLTQIFSQLELQFEAGYESRFTRGTLKAQRRAIKKAGGRYFAISRRHGRLAPGVYLRERERTGGGGVKPVLIFVSGTQYAPRFDFYGVARRVTDQQLVPKFIEAIHREISRSGR
jgi:hypothetical protein